MQDRQLSHRDDAIQKCIQVFAFHSKMIEIRSLSEQVILVQIDAADPNELGIHEQALGDPGHMERPRLKVSHGFDTLNRRKFFSVE
jgi:hypothetical protein